MFQLLLVYFKRPTVINLLGLNPVETEAIITGMKLILIRRNTCLLSQDTEVMLHVDFIIGIIMVWLPTYSLRYFLIEMDRSNIPISVRIIIETIIITDTRLYIQDQGR